MRALLLSNRRPNDFGPGDAKIAAHVLRVLRNAGHTVDALWPREGWGLADHPAQRLMAVVRGAPLRLAATYSAPFARTVGRFIDDRGPNVIVAVHAGVTQYVPESARRRTFAVIIDAYANNYQTYASALSFPRSALYRTEAKRMARYERTLTRNFGRVGVVSLLDRQRLAADADREDAVVHVPYAVDGEYFHTCAPKPWVRDNPFLFSGSLFYAPNRDAASRLILDIWPAIRAGRAGRQLIIAGARPSRPLRQLARRNHIHLIADPADMRPLLLSSCAMVVPMRIGGGVQTKILEAMISRLPVVCSAFANRGIGATPGKHLLIADEPREFRDQVESLYSDPARTEALRSAAFAWVTQRHSLEAFSNVLLAQCDQIAGA
jgi:polysaccharide biosynthesis protein PslH